MTTAMWLFVAALVVAALLWVSPWVVQAYIRFVEKREAGK